MHFFQTADAVEMALGKDISQSGATFYPIYSNTSKKYLTHYLPKPSREGDLLSKKKRRR